MNLSKLLEIVEDRRAWHAIVHGVRYDLVTDQQQEQQPKDVLCNMREYSQYLDYNSWKFSSKELNITNSYFHSGGMKKKHSVEGLNNLFHYLVVT